jgi:DNA repair protein SbcD/Mre11
MTTTQPPRTTLRLAHCSDIHLDDSHGAAAHYRAGFDRVLEQMQQRRPDVVVIAGDLFDTNRVPDSTVTWAMARLEAQPCPVILIPGNHDCMEPGGVFTRYDFDAINNVEMLAAEAGELRVLADFQLAVWGKGMLDHCAEYRPIDDAHAKPEQVNWYVGLGHGMYVPDGENTYRSSPVYQHAIASSPFDYLALGHHHAALEVHAGGTAAAYCGSPTDTVGRGATYAVIDLNTAAPAQVEIHIVTP